MEICRSSPADESFRLVDDSGTSVFVPLGERGGRLLAAIRNDSLDIREMREIQRFSVNVAPWQLRDLEDRSAVAREGGMNMYVLEPHDGTLGSYSRKKAFCWKTRRGRARFDRKEDTWAMESR